MSLDLQIAMLFVLIIVAFILYADAIERWDE